MGRMSHLASLGAVVGLAGALVLAGCGSSSSNSGGSGGGTAAASGNASTCKAGSAVGTSGNFVELCLPYNQIAFGAAGQANTPGYDGGGYALDPTDPAWPKETAAQAKTTGVQTTASGVGFWFPPTGGGAAAIKDSVDLGPNGGPLTLTVPPGKYKALDILGSAGNGCSGCGVDITFTYTDGSTDKATQPIDDWCTSSPSGQTGFMPADRWSNGASASPACGVFVYPVAIPGTSKTLKSVSIVNDPNNASNYEPEILSLTLTK